MIQVAAAVKYNFLYAFGHCFFGNRFAYGFGSFHVAAVILKGLFNSAGCRDGLTGFIVDNLGVDVTQGTVYVQAGSFGGANYISAGTNMTFLAFFVPVQLGGGKLQLSS